MSSFYAASGGSPPRSRRFPNGFYPGQIAPPQPALDFEVSNHGSVFLLQPLTRAARSWADEHLVVESWQMFGPAIAVDHHLIADIVAGIQRDGLVLGQWQDAGRPGERRPVQRQEGPVR